MTDEKKTTIAAIQIAFYPTVEINPKRFSEIMGAAFSKIGHAHGGKHFQFADIQMSTFAEVPKKQEKEPDKPLIITPGT